MIDIWIVLIALVVLYLLGYLLSRMRYKGN
jgi:hypothetical protein